MTLFNTMEARRARKPVCEFRAVNVYVVQAFDELVAALSIRSRVFLSEQECPYTEEFDGNDLAGATHLLATKNGEPIGTMRVRWFGEFAKFERFAVLPKDRSMDAALALMSAGYDLAARKGFSTVLGHVQTRVVPFWVKMGGGEVRTDRPTFCFSGYEFVEVMRELDRRDDRLTINSPALVLDRPEGDWDRSGVLERSSDIAA